MCSGKKRVREEGSEQATSAPINPASSGGGDELPLELLEAAEAEAAQREEEEALGAQAEAAQSAEVPVGAVQTSASAPVATKEAAGGVTVVATGGTAVQSAGQRLVFDGDATAGEAAVDTRGSAMAFLASTLYGGARGAARGNLGSSTRRKGLHKGLGRPAAQFTRQVAAVDPAAAAAAAMAGRKRSRR